MRAERPFSEVDRRQTEAVERRLGALRQALGERELDAFLSLKLVNTYYLSGFTSLDTVRPNSYTRPFAVIVDTGGGACLVIPQLDEEAAEETSAVAGISEVATETEGLVRLREATAALGETSTLDAGVHSAMPHEFTTAKLLASGELMWHCWLVSYRGYWVENVRTGIVSNEDGHADAYRALHESLLAGQDAARPGATAGDGFRAVMAC